MADLKIEKYSIGVGDRFAHQAKAQLQAFLRAAREGAPAVPVWNKSNREHNIVGSEPSAVRIAADQAVAELGWTKAYYVDADHINLNTVDRFLDASNFFTLDVAEAIGKRASAVTVEEFLGKHPELIGNVQIPGIDEPFQIDREMAQGAANKYLSAVQEAGAIYRKIEARKGKGTFITEVSMDETDSPQTPPELLLILAAIADEKIPVQTIAPKFTGRFNKGVDYVGDLVQFEKEFGDDLAVLEYSIKQYGLPETLKLSVHSGSDKFSIYGPIRRQLLKFGAGLHLKTAGTTWLEELIGLSEAGAEGLAMAKEIYSEAYSHREELCAPYASVIDIDPAKLPAPEDVDHWTAEQYSGALRHDQTNPAFNMHVRQLLHVGFKVAAKMGPRYLSMLEKCEATIAKNVTENLYERHLKPLFLA